MAHTIKLTRGSDELELNTGSNILLEYIPRAPRISTIDTNDVREDGGQRTNATYRNVTESAKFQLRPLKGTTNSNSASVMQTTLREVQQFFEYARRRQRTGIGDKVFVEFQPDGSASLYRSEILSGRHQVSNRSLNWRWTGASSVDFDVFWTRRFYWEGPETQVLMTNTCDPTPASLVSIQNHNDGTEDNLVEIAASNVEGDLPARVKLNIENVSGVERTNRVFIGHNVLSSPSSFNYVLQGQDSSTGTTGSSALASGGEFQSSSTAGDTEIDMFTWTLTASQVEHASSNYFHIIPRFFTANDIRTAKFRFKMEHTAGGNTIWEGDQVKLPSSPAEIIADLDVIQIPPWKPLNLGNLRTIAFIMTGQEDGGFDVDLDFIHLFTSDNFRDIRAVQAVAGPDTNEWLVDDGIDEITYAESNTGTLRRAEFITKGNYIELSPNELQRLYFLINDSSVDTARINRVSRIKMAYRPRILQI